MAALESSLEGGRKALLALDLSGLGARTQEQILLCHELAAVLEQAGREGDALPGRLESAKGLGTLPLQLEEVQMMAKHIVSAVRLQCALLARSRTKLRVMANMLAGPGAAYGPRLAERL